MYIIKNIKESEVEALKLVTGYQIEKTTPLEALAEDEAKYRLENILEFSPSKKQMEEYVKNAKNGLSDYFLNDDDAFQYDVLDNIIFEAAFKCTSIEKSIKDSTIHKVHEFVDPRPPQIKVFIVYFNPKTGEEEGKTFIMNDFQQVFKKTSGDLEIAPELHAKWVNFCNDNDFFTENVAKEIIIISYNIQDDRRK